VSIEHERRGPTQERVPRRLRDRLLDPLRWDDVHQRLAAQPVFESCSRSEVRQLARAGDECVVPAGTVLCKEDRIGYWFFVVTGGSIRLTRKGKTLATLGPGSHLGEVAILGFAPQPMTATAVVDSTVFVLGRRSVLDFSYSLPGLQHGLFPDVAPARFQQKVRDLRAEGNAEWRRLPKGRAAAAARATSAAGPSGRGELLPLELRTFPSRGHTAAGPALSRLVIRWDRADADAPARALARQPLSRRFLASAAATTVAAALVVGFAFHPGVLVVHPSTSLDVTGDLTVDGMSVRPADAHYILTAVVIEEPNLIGAVKAMIDGDETLPAARGDALAEQRRIGREEYRDSQRRAVELVARRSGLDPKTVHVRFRDRHLAGPSAGLLYALLLADMAGHVDVAHGRTVAATGVLADGGRVQPVGFVELKRRVADRAHADVFLVPRGSVTTTARGGPKIVPVANFEDALEAVRAST
jgi:PDZ domain-containing secreted protein/CRP-like cAMP-binding protein